MTTYQGVIVDPYSTAVPRPVQNKGAGVEIDSFGYAVPRPAQRVSGYFIEPTATGGGEGKINTPRKSPLENRWKKVNAKNFR